MYDDDDGSFESPLATFTRQYASTEDRKARAWKGWLNALHCQYDRDKIDDAVAQLDYGFFGCDIVFLASAWGGTYFIDKVSPHVAWHQLKRDANMAESVETKTPDHNNLCFSQEPSFWLWFFECHHKHSENQWYDVEYCLDTIFRSGALTMEHRVPSYSFGHDITFRSMLVAWEFDTSHIRFENILSGSPIADDEAADIVVAHAATGCVMHSNLTQIDQDILTHLTTTVDYCAPYPLSPHFQTILNTEHSHLPLGVLVCALLMRGYHSNPGPIEHIIQNYPEIIVEHFELLYGVCLRDNALQKSFGDDRLADVLFRDQPHFDIHSCIAPLLKTSLSDITSFNNSSFSKTYVQTMVQQCAQRMDLSSIFTEDETTLMLQQIFDLFSVRKTHNNHIQFEKVDAWWSNPQGWEHSIRWFDPTVQAKVKEFMNPIVADGILVGDGTHKPHYGSSPRNDDDAQNTKRAAQMTLDLFSAHRWNEEVRKLKM